MARKRRLLSPKSFKPLYIAGKRDKAERFVVIRGKDAGTLAAVISKAEMITRTQGAHPKKPSAAHKAGVLQYKSAASEQQARKQIKTRRLFKRPREGDWLHPEEIYGTHIFLTKTGVEQRASFNGRNLIYMQGYRDDVYGREDKYGITTHPGALQTGDGSALKKYGRLKIYDVNGNRVRPETDIGKLRRWWDRKSSSARIAFENELYQSGEGEQRAAA